MVDETNLPNDGIDKLSEKSEFIGPAQTGVNLYKPIVPPVFDLHTLPGSANISNPVLSTKDASKGSAPYHPKPVNSNNPKLSFGEALNQQIKAAYTSRQDKNAYSKIYAYDSSPKGAHKARYKAYGQKTYDEIGFTPEIDNETWFNANTTMYDDWKRMATNAAWPMMKLGFMSPIKSYGKLFGQADIGQDLAEARDYEEYNAIGYSTKGGIGGFAINLQNSAAYSVGIIAESVIEGALIGAAVGAIGGEGIGAAPGAVVGGVAEGFGALLRLPKTLFQMSKNLGKMTMNLKKLQNLSEVKNIFKGAGSTMGNFINPFSNTTEAAMKYVFKNPDDLSNLARTARTAGAMWHDVKNINAALSEGRLEGGFTEQRVYDELYNKYYEKYGEAPTDELQKSMRKQAKVAGFQNTWKNTLLVHYSNNIAFPSMTKAGFMKGLPQFSKTMGNVGPYQIIFDPSKKVAEDLYRFEKISLRNAAKALTKPATYGKTALNYFKANLVEGIQESAQDVLADATESYYVDSFKNKDRQNFDYSMATLGAAMKKQISMQGLETFASGFAMGSILGIPGGVKEFLSVGYNKYFKHRANYDEYIKEREGAVKEIVDALNTMDKGAKHFFDPRMNNYVNQMLVGKVADSPEDNSTKEAKDASFAGFQSAVRTALRTGTFDMFLENFEGYKQASPEDIEDAWRLEPGQGAKALEFIDTAIGNAKSIAARWQYAKDKFKHVINPNDYAENTPEREMAEIYNQAYLTGLDNLVFTGAAFDNNAERLNKMYSKLSSIPTIQNSRFSDFAAVTDPARLQKEIAMLRTEVEAGKSATTPEAKEQYEKQKNILEKLESYQKEQTMATVDFLMKIKETTKNILKNEEGISANEAQAKAVDQVVDEYEKAGLNPFENYKKSYRELLDALAGSEDNKVKLNREIDEAGGMDVLFEMLMDTHVLRNENMNLNKFINLLNSPQDFYEHVQRNFEWMTKLYNNRQEYYEEAVKNSITAIQRNTLLEELAEQGIFVDLEEFAEWCKDKRKLPTYLIDQVNKRIINQDSYLYDKYIELFKLAENAEVDNPIIPKKEEDSKLKRTIDNYNEQRNGEIESVKNVYDRNLKDLLGFTQEEIEKQRAEVLGDTSMTVEEAVEEQKLAEKALAQLDSVNHLEVQAVLDMAAEKEMFTPQEYNLAKEELFSNEAAVEQVADVASKFTDAEEDEAVEAASNVIILKPLIEKRIATLKAFQENQGLEGIPEYENTQPYEEYNKAVDAINKKYDALIEKAIQESEEAVRKEVDAKRPAEMKKAIKEVQDLFGPSQDIVQTKRNYIVDGELHDRMSNRIKTGYDTYGYTGEADLIDLYDRTIGAALAGERIQTSNIEAKKADIERINNEKKEALNKADTPKLKGFERLSNLIGKPFNELSGSDINESNVVNVLNEIYRIRKNGGLTDVESRRLQRLEDAAKSIGFEIINPIGKKYDERDAIDVVNFVEGTSSDSTDKVITRVVRPQVNKNDILEQRAQVEVMQSATEEEINNAINKFKEDSINKRKNQINAKYDAELAALEQSKQTPISSSETEVKKADIKIGNTEYEVKADGVYWYGKKLDNPENKSHRQLIEADIKKRRQEELNNIGKKDVVLTFNTPVEFISTAGTFDTTSVKYTGEVTEEGTKSKLKTKLVDTSYTLPKTYHFTQADNPHITLTLSEEKLLEEINAKYDAELAALEAPVSDKKADVIQTYEYKGETQTVKKETSTKDGVTKVTFVGERSDKPGRKFKSGYVYGGYTSNPLQQFFDDYGVTLENIAEGLSIDHIVGITVLEERTFEGKTAITFKLSYSEKAGGMSSEPMEMAVEKQKFTSNAELDALEQPATSGVLTQELINEFIQELIDADLPGVNTNKYTVDIVRDQLETLIAPEGTRLSQKTQRNITKLKAQLEDVEAKLTATEDKARKTSLEKQKAQLEQAIKDEESGKFEAKFELTNDNIKSFVLNTVKENAYEESRDAGNVIDPMLKDYLDTATSKKPEFDPKKMTKEAYDALFDDETGYLTKIKKMADAGEIYIFTKDLIVHSNDLVDAEGNKLPPVAGEIDMIIVDRKGKKYIVDLKTGKVKKWLNYKTVGTDSYKKQLENTLQQTGYANLAENMSGDKFETMIFPLEVSFDQKGFIVSAGAPTNPTLFAGEEVIGDAGTQPYTIKLDKGNIIQVKKEDTNVYENLSIDEFMQRLIPVKGKTAAQVKKQPTPSQNIPENERDMVDAFMANLVEAQELDDFVELAHELDTKKPTMSKESYQMLKEQLDRRMSMTFDETGKVVIKTGEIYIFTEPVKAHKVTEGYRVKVDSFDPKAGTVTVSRIGPGRKKTFTMSISDFNSNAMSEEQLSNLSEPQEEYVPTQEEIELLTESMSNTDEQLSDFEQLAKWESEASADDVTLDNLKNDFLDNIKC